MKRAFTVMLFGLCGLFATWTSLWLAARIDWRKLPWRMISIPRADGCYEIDHCPMPWYAGFLMLAYLLLPTAIHVVAGWRLGGRQAAIGLQAIALLALLVGTVGFYFIGHGR
jgi:hypothetical protein